MGEGNRSAKEDLSHFDCATEAQPQSKNPSNRVFRPYQLVKKSERKKEQHIQQGIGPAAKPKEMDSFWPLKAEREEGNDQSDQNNIAEKCPAQGGCLARRSHGQTILGLTPVSMWLLRQRVIANVLSTAGRWAENLQECQQFLATCQSRTRRWLYGFQRSTGRRAAWTSSKRFILVVCGCVSKQVQGYFRLQLQSPSSRR